MAEVIAEFVVGVDGVGEGKRKLVRLFQLNTKTDKITNEDSPYFIARGGKGQPRFSVGHVYEMPFIDNKSFAVGRAKFKRAWHDETRVLGWQTEQAALATANRMQKAQDKIEKSDSMLAKKFEPFVLMYWGMTREERIGFEVWMLTQLHKGVPRPL